MDQTNPLSEVTHKRRLSALGPGGLTRERAGFEVRDVHPTHYGRICPIETPEGPNIGLIASLSTYARVNEFGFVETPYRKVDGRQGHRRGASSTRRSKRRATYIAQANAPIDEKGKFTDDLVSARHNGDFVMVDARRGRADGRVAEPAGVGRRVADPVPRARRREPRAHGLEHAAPGGAAAPHRRAARRHRHGGASSPATPACTVVAKRDGIVEIGRRRPASWSRPTGRRATTAAPSVDIYNLIKFQRSNQNTCINQKPIVRAGDTVKAGDVLADGPATEHGRARARPERARRVHAVEGYNFEDSILITERIVKDDVFTSIHIEEFECVARDTKLGKEEITRDIPNVGEEALKDLDESGIVRIGAEVKPGDILVGKITPKGETQLSPEEKLLRAIFGEKAGDVRDTSLRVPPGVDGIVINARVFSRKGTEKDERAKDIEDAEKREARRRTSATR